MAHASAQKNLHFLLKYRNCISCTCNVLDINLIFFLLYWNGAFIDTVLHVCVSDHVDCITMAEGQAILIPFSAEEQQTKDRFLSDMFNVPRKLAEWIFFKETHCTEHRNYTLVYTCATGYYLAIIRQRINYFWWSCRMHPLLFLSVCQQMRKVLKLLVVISASYLGYRLWRRLCSATLIMSEEASPGVEETSSTSQTNTLMVVGVMEGWKCLDWKRKGKLLPFKQQNTNGVYSIKENY